MSPGRSATRILKTAQNSYCAQYKVYFDVITTPLPSLKIYRDGRALKDSGRKDYLGPGILTVEILVILGNIVLPGCPYSLQGYSGRLGGC
jgi:hypothetical protein